MVKKKMGLSDRDLRRDCDVDHGPGSFGAVVCGRPALNLVISWSLYPDRGCASTGQERERKRKDEKERESER